MVARIFIIILAALLTVAPRDEARADDRLYRVMEDRLIEIESGFQHGSFEFFVECQYGPLFRPIKVEGTAFWDGDDAFWVFKASDPDKRMKPSYDWNRDLSEAPTQYFLRKKGTIAAYNPFLKIIYIKDIKNIEFSFRGMELYEVFPRSNWLTCYAPHHLNGHPWSKMIGPTSVGMSRDSRLSIERQGDLVVQTREDPSAGHTWKVYMDLGAGGHVVKFDSYAKGKSRRVGEYHWVRWNGTFILKEYHYSERDGRDKETTYYKLIINNYHNTKPPGETFALNTLIGFVPKDVIVQDLVGLRLFRPQPAHEISDRDFDRLIESLKQGNLYKK